jgi:hypothetical protein
LRSALRKYAAISRQIHEAVLQKEGGVLGALGSMAMKNPLSTLFAGASMVGGAAAAKGKYKQYKAGFDPRAQNAMLGQAPTPPGAQ